MPDIEDLKTLAGRGGQLGQLAELQGTDAVGVWRGSAGAMLLGWAQPDALIGELKHALTVTPISAFVTTANGTADNTAGLQAAIDAAPAGGTVLGDPAAHYRWTNLLIQKSLTLDFNGAEVTVDPTTSGVSGNPAIWGRGALGTERGLASNALEGSLTVALSAGGADFAPGDYVVIEDDEVVPGWSAEAPGYTTKREVNTVASRDGNTLTVGAPLLNTYMTTEDARVRKITSAPTIRVRNIRRAIEVDPGGAYSGSMIGAVPHVIHFQWCDRPAVENVHIDGFQLHAVNAFQCIGPLTRACSFAHGFRPTTGGHAYGVRYHSCLGGVALANHGLRLRHLFDTTAGYASFSAFNTDLQTYSASYLTHGHMTVGWASYCDVSIGQAAVGGMGFALGNPDFSVDRRLTLVNPRVEGVSHGINCQAGVEDCTVINPMIRTLQRGISYTSGAKRLKIQGGQIDMRGVLESGSYGVLVRDKLRAADELGEYPIDLEIHGTTIFAPDQNNAIFANLLGTITLRDLTVIAQTGVTSTVDIGNAQSPGGVVVQNSTFMGACTRHLFVRAGTDLVHITGNTFADYTTDAANISPIARMNVSVNTAEAAGDITFSASVPAGAVVANNAPEAT